MTSLLVVVVAALLLVAAGLHIAKNRALPCWLLVPFPLIGCAAALVEISRGPNGIGEAAFKSDQKQLGYLAVLLLVSLLAALRPQWAWLFWLAWAFNALVCGILVYVAFFWKVFS